ncbi:MAG TPA: GDSL-type esterase/lipase family protein [Fodinibius sp.]|nr:GDSL-type esterase/lipase family protein [Fodinibius sp.]
MLSKFSTIPTQLFLAGFLYFLALSLVASAQQSAVDTASQPFAEEIEAFKKADRQKMPPKDAILFVGSSSIRQWTTLKEDFSNKEVINRGFGGSQFSDLLRYDDQIVYPYKPRQIFIYEGDNDLNAGNSPEQVLQDFKAFVKRSRERLPETELVFISIKPSPSRIDLFEEMKEANQLIKAYSKETQNIRYADIFHAMLDEDGEIRTDIFTEDMLHLNAKGYDLWERIIRPYLD